MCVNKLSAAKKIEHIFWAGAFSKRISKSFGRHRE
jgi:hypothetical protein